MAKMKRTKEEKKALERAKTRAIADTLHGYFTGVGAPMRVMKFCGRVSLYGAAGTAIMLCYMSWVMVAALHFVPGHEGALKELQAWMIATPLDQVEEVVHGQARYMLTSSLEIGVVMGLAVALWKIVSPAISDVRARFNLAAQ